MPERLMSVEASQPDKRRDRRDEQSENMPPLEFEEDMKFVTLTTSQPVRSRLVSDEQPENMPERSVAEEVSQPERSKD